uniref:Uncharacterized protein n=1 Tax=Kalanchoe fedtschenkoi TaxID=63787 RepID=A0A7N0ZYG8_KALFE
MGCRISSPHKPPWENSNIRVVHLDGRIEDYDEPIRVNQIIQNPKMDVLCTKSQLLCPTCSYKALDSECELELGNLYFLMPISAFRSEASVTDMANTVNKLTSIANTTRLKLKQEECPRPVGRGSGPDRVESEKSLDKCVWKPVLDTIGEMSSEIRV